MHNHTSNVHSKLFLNIKFFFAHVHRYVDIIIDVYQYVDISSIFFFQYIDIIDTLNVVSMTALAYIHIHRKKHPSTFMYTFV